MGARGSDIMFFKWWGWKTVNPEFYSQRRNEAEDFQMKDNLEFVASRPTLKESLQGSVNRKEMIKGHLERQEETAQQEKIWVNILGFTSLEFS